MQLPVCVLCWYRRMCLFPLALILPFGLFPPDRKVVRCALPLAVIAQDIADGRTLNVTKTPEFFVNGRPLPVFGYEELKKLVDLALKETQQR